MSNGCGHANRIEVRLDRLTIIDTADRKLPQEVGIGRQRDSCRERIRSSAIDVPTILIRLPAMKSGGLQLNRTARKTRGDDVVRNVSGILLVMAKNGYGILAR